MPVDVDRSLAEEEYSNMITNCQNHTNVGTMTWLSKSPYLIISEHLEGILKRKVEQISARLESSMLRRVESVIKNKSGYTKH